MEETLQPGELETVAKMLERAALAMLTGDYALRRAWVSEVMGVLGDGPGRETVDHTVSTVVGLVKSGERLSPTADIHARIMLKV